MWKVFWFARGALAACTVASIVPNFLDLTRWEFLRAFHALVVGWRSVAGALGRLIGELPFMPPLSAMTVNMLVLLGAVGFPGAWGVLKYWGEVSFPRDDESAPRFEMAIFKWAQVIIVLLGTASLAALAHGEVLLDPVQTTFFALFVLGGWGASMYFLPGYFRGLVFVVSFVAAMQALYYLNAPWLSDTIRSATTDVLGP
jgi:hypothetical protein